MTFRKNWVLASGLWMVLVLGVSYSCKGQLCNITASIEVEKCDQEGTPCDPTDDTWYLRATVSNPGGSDFWECEFNGVRYGPFMIAPLPIAVARIPAAGLPPLGTICVTFFERDNPACMTEACVDSVFPCAVAPMLNIVSLICNDNRTANDPTDDFYRVQLSVGLAGAALWPGRFEIDVAGLNFGPYEYNKLVTIDIPADGTMPVLAIEDNRDSWCIDSRQIGPLVPCSVPCAQAPSIISQECLNMDTPDPKDDVWVISFISTAVTPGVTNRYEVITPGIPGLPFQYGMVNQIFLPARGQTQTMRFSDFDYDDCWEEIEIGPLDHCSIQCNVKTDSIILKCSDNGTPDPLDDYYDVCISVTGEDAGSGYTVRIRGDEYGPFEYSKVETFRLPADGDMPRLNIRDVDFASQCNTFAIIGPLDPCSTPCDLEVDKLIEMCDDQGTSDPADDTYNILIHVINNQGTAADRYEVLINASTQGPFEYGIDESFNWPADGNTYPLIIRDVALGASCELLDTIGPLIPCSSDCILDIQVSNVRCNNEGTGLDNADDTYTFDLTINGQNVGSGWMADDPNNTTGNYGGNANFGPFLIANGNTNLTITDRDDPFCREMIEIPAPAPCSDSCFLTLESSDIGPCNDNNTGPDRTDDFFFVEIVVSAINPGAAGTYTVTLGATPIGSYSYNVNENVGPLPANGANLNLVITDDNIAYCQTTLRVRQDPCSDCAINTADAGPDKVISCQANTVTLEGGASSQGNFEWVGPSGNTYNGSNPVVGEPGQYILTVTFDKQCVAKDTVIVTRDQNLPVADPGPVKDITCEVDSVTVGGSNTSTGPNIVYIWTNSQGAVVSRDRLYTTGDPGRYCLQAIDTLLDCPSASNCVDVGENKTPPSGNILVSPEDAFDCRIDSISLIADNGDSTTFFWESKAITYFRDTLWVTDTGMVYLILKDTINGCTTRLDVEINSLVDYPLIFIQDPADITCLAEEIIINANSSQTGPGIIHQWFASNNRPIQGANTRMLRVTQPGFYYFESIDTVTGCVNRDTIEVDEDRIFHTANAGEDELIKCDSLSIILDAGLSTQKNNITYQWDRISGDGNVINGNGTLFPEIDGQGLFVLRVIDDITGCTSMDTVFVDRAFAPMLDRMIVEGERCGGDESGVIDVTGIRGIRPFTYELNGRPVDTTRFEGLKPGLFFFRVTDSLGCYTDSLVEINEGNYFDFRIQGDTFIIKGDSTTLSVDINIPQSEVDQVYWEEDGSVFCFRCYSVTVKPDTTTVYNFRLIDINGCSYEFTFVVRVQERNDIFVPNIFTPNGDTDNEILHVFGKNLVLIENKMIFNRWGELVFKGNNLPPGPIWDGKWNGEYHVPAVLTYLIDARFKDGELKRFTGDVALLR